MPAIASCQSPIFCLQELIVGLPPRPSALLRPVFAARQRYVEDVVGTPTLRRRSTGYWSHPFNPELTLAATRGYKPRLVFLSDYSS